jgi:hypothetical protein
MRESYPWSPVAAPPHSSPGDLGRTIRGPLRTERWFRLFLLLFLVGYYSPRSSIAWAGGAAPSTTPLADGIRHFALPLNFEANQGQADGQVKYSARGHGYTLFLTSRAAVLSLRDGRAGHPATACLRMILQGAAATPVIRGEEKLPGQSHYFLGNDPGKWRMHVPTYARVRYERVYPGVDLVYYGQQGELETDFAVAAGADPAVIAWHLEGARAIRVDAAGDLLLMVGGNEVRLHRPQAYQGDTGERREVAVRYRVRGQRVSLVLGRYDRGQTLVIDPVLTYSTYLGGSGGDQAYALAIDSSLSAYVAGTTASVNFPTTPGGVQTANAGGGGDIFLTKFNPAGTGVVFSLFLGGSGTDVPSAILLDSTGNIYITGSTLSPNFPTTSGVLQPTYGGNGDAFLAELDPSGSSLVFSTYLGGSGTDYATAMTFDSKGDIFLTGSTTSKDFPTLNPLQLGNDGASDAFVTEINPNGSALLYSTYLGGSNADYATAIALVNPSNSDGPVNVYVGGYTYSANFPTQNAYQSALAGGSDAFVTELIPGNTALVFSTFLGGSSIDRVFAMVLDPGGSIYLTGDTQSSNFPVTANAFQSTNHGGPGDAFVTKLAPGAAALVYSTLLGGSGTDQASAMALDSAGDVYVAGLTQSSDFPLLDPLQKILGISGAGTCGSPSAPVLCADVFVAKLGPSGSPVYSTLLGGSGTDSGQALVIDAWGAVYVAGSTASPNFPATPGAFQWAYAGAGSSSTAFVAKINPQDAPSLGLSPQQINFGNQPLNTSSDPTTVTLTNEGSAPLSISSITASGDFAQTNNGCGTLLPAGGGTCTFQVRFTPSQLGQQVNEVSISDNLAGSPQHITVTGNGVFPGRSLLLSPTSLSFSAQVVDSTSPPQSLVLVNNGDAAVTLTNIAASGDFAQTNTCGDLPTTPTVLNVGQGCTISVTFTPTASGNRTGGLSIQSDAERSPGATLTGIGIPVFSLSANTRSTVLLIGTTSNSTAFSIAASAPSTFTGRIGLACGTGATCSFNPSSIVAGQSSTLTVSGLSATTANPLNFTVNGTYGAQTASVALTVFFADFSVSATPSGATVTAGNSATYTVTVTPSNGFNQVVLLGCSGIPLNTDSHGNPYTTCTFSPPGVTPSGSGPVTATLTIATTAQSGLFHWRPREGIPPSFGMWPVILVTLGFLTALTAGLCMWGLVLRPNVRFALLAIAMILVALAVGCNTYVNPINITPVVTGTPTGNYTVVLRGTLGNNTGVSRAAAVSLSVAP